jgi:hypothetical protein
VSASTPAFAAQAATTPSSATSQVGATSLGAVSLLGLPVRLDGTLGTVSTVTSSGAIGEQALDVTDLALPSIADLLAALGVDLSALPVSVLYELLDELDLLTTTVTELKSELDAAAAGIQAQIDAAQEAVDDATAQVIAETAKLDPALAELKAAQDQLTAATAAVRQAEDADAAARQTVVDRQAELAAASSALNAKLTELGLTLAEYEALPPALKAPLEPVVEPLKSAVAAKKAAVDDATAAATKAAADLAAAQDLRDAAEAAVALAEAAVAAVQALIDAAQQLLDDALALLDSILTQVGPQFDALRGAVVAVLDGTPLVSLDALQVVTRTSVTSAAAGGQSAEVVGGKVSGLRVLGTDVLQDVLDTTSVELLDLTPEQLGQVGGLIDTLTGILSDVLSTVPGFPSLSIPAPQVDLLEETTSTGVVDGFGTASAGVQLLRVSLPAITLPVALQLPGAASLPVFPEPAEGLVQAAAVGDLVSTPVSLAVGGLTPQSSFRPGVAATTGAPTTGTPTAGTPTTGTPTAGTPTAGTPSAGTPANSLPRTGASALVALAGISLLGTAALLRRRRAGLEPGTEA